jgi:hypothetical protein
MLKILTEFDHNDFIPQRYTCEGENINPKIVVLNIPKNAKSLAIICEDPDAPSKTFVHWLIWNIPVKNSPVIIAEGLPKTNTLFDGSIQGYNDFGKIGYDGPCPPKKHGIHHYFFKIYALNTLLTIDGKITKKILEKSIESHIIDRGEIIGLYQRS